MRNARAAIFASSEEVSRLISDHRAGVTAVDRLVDRRGRSIGLPSAHIRSFQLLQSNLSAVRIRAPPLVGSPRIARQGC